MVGRLSEVHRRRISRSVKKWWKLNRGNSILMQERSRGISDGVKARGALPANKGVSIYPKMPCLKCGQEFLARPSRRRDGTLQKPKFCSRKCFDTYLRAHWHELHPKVDFYSKRFLVREIGRCERCGFSDTRILMTHHKNGKRSDNRRENLLIVCPNCHALEHLNSDGKLDFRGWHRLA